MFFARSSQRAYFAFGHPEPLSNSEVIVAQLVERSGIFYQPLCSKIWRVCIVAAEPRAAMMVTEKLYTTLPPVGGAIIGGFLALTVLLFLRRQRSLARRPRRAIRRGELSVAYQPVVDLETREVTGAEALARWRDESNEMVPPDLFIEAAEQGGFIQEITQLILERVVEEIDDLLRLGNFRVTINITMQDLTSPSFFEHIYECMKASKIKPGTLGFELTERSTGDREMARDAIAHLKSLGHSVYIDDFGTGYSSLAYLHDLSVDAIKIDRAFTATVGTQAVTASVVPQILEMASQLDLTVVVEGIETEEQAEYFRAAGRGIMGQGWLFGKPVSAEQLKRQIAVAVA
jgi:sensor c-di-GMP phosphodiesterase-like protein